MIKEACVQNAEEAVQAEALGAHEIELCVRLDLDGNSPPILLIKKVLNAVTIPVKVIVNPIPFHYQYSLLEKEAIQAYIEKVKSLPISGLVIGPLTRDRLPDIAFLKEIRAQTFLPITFHKAIDECDIPKSIATLMESSLVDFILSSGGAPSAIEGRENLRQMKEQLSGSKIQLIAAGKITAKNLPQLHESLQLKYYHGRKIVAAH